MPETLTDAQKVMRNSTGLAMAVQLERIADGVSANINLGLTGAAVGDLARVAAVDANGKPTSWEHVPLSDIVTNQNLLDNWYFVGGGSQQGDGQFPINQHGQITYPGTGWTVDRFYSATNATQVEIRNSCIRLQKTSAAGGGSTQFRQTLESPVRGMVTLSAILLAVSGSPVAVSIRDADSNSLKGVTIQPSASKQLIQVTYDGSGNPAANVQFAFTSASEQNSYVDIEAIKLELGSYQTLAHQDADSNWVLNGIPDYGEELAKCQRYLVLIPNFAVREMSHTSNRIDYSLSLPVTPAGNMYIVDTSPLIVYEWSTNTQQTGFSYELRLAASNMPNIRATKSSHDLSDSYLIATNLLLSCEQ